MEAILRVRMAEKQAVKAEAGGPAGLHLQGKSSALMRIRNMRTAAKNGGDSAPLKPQKAGITVAELKAESRDPAGRTGLKGSAVKVGTKTVGLESSRVLSCPSTICRRQREQGRAAGGRTSS